MIISYAAEDAARVAELLLAAGRATEIPRWLRYGALPETIELELSKVAAASKALDVAAEIERVVAARIASIESRS